MESKGWLGLVKKGVSGEHLHAHSVFPFTAVLYYYTKKKIQEGNEDFFMGFRLTKKPNIKDYKYFYAKHY